MKKIIILCAALACFAEANAQKYTVRRNIVQQDSVQNERPAFLIEKAGSYMERSARCQMAGFTLTALSGCVLATGYVRDSKPAKIVGFSALAAAVACEVLSIEYKFKAGRSLRLSVGELVLKF